MLFTRHATTTTAVHGGRLEARARIQVAVLAETFSDVIVLLNPNSSEYLSCISKIVCCIPWGHVTVHRVSLHF